MSAIEKPQPVWPYYKNDQLNPKYEKCRHIAEEIYKRIDITFQIKSLGTASQSDGSEQSDQIDIDSNDLSNETDLFACDKSDSIPSSASDTRERKCLNVNNNEVKKTVVPVYKPPRKRFRKKVKKRAPKPSSRSDSEGSSDEALPLSRIVVDANTQDGEDSVESVMGVPKIVILTGLGEGNERIKDTRAKPAPLSPLKQLEGSEAKPALNPEPHKSSKEDNKPGTNKQTKPDANSKDGAKSADVININVKTPVESKKCSMCSLSFRGERGLRRHMALSHILIPEDITRPKTRKSEARAV